MSQFRGPAYGSGMQLAFPPLTPMVRLILIALAASFVVQTALQLVGLSVVVYWLALTPAKIKSLALWQLLTYGLLHGSIQTPQMGNLWHLAFNCLGLYFFGGDVERVLGSRRFLWFFVACVLGGGLLFALVGLLAGAAGRVDLLSTPVIGASGGVLGVVLAFAMLFPKRQIFLFPIPVPIRAWFLAAAYLVLNLYGALVDGGSGVAYTAHLGGMAAAFLYLRWIRRGPGGPTFRNPFRRRKFDVLEGRGGGPWGQA